MLAIKVIKIMMGGKESKKLDLVSLSNNAAKKCIVDMPYNVLEQMINEVKNSRLYSI